MVETEQQSLVVVKKLLAIAVSSITYLRGLFPEKAYGSKRVEGETDRLCGERTVSYTRSDTFDQVCRSKCAVFACTSCSDETTGLLHVLEEHR